MGAIRRLLADLEALAASDAGHRLAVLKRIEALYRSFDASSDAEKAAVFDEVLLRLSQGLDTVERASLSRRLAADPGALRLVAGSLAADPDPTVAIPVLAGVDALEEQLLVSIATMAGQPQLLAMSGRRLVTIPVSDIIVRRGDQAVLHTLARNGGARFSDGGLTTLVSRAAADPSLDALLRARADVDPRALGARPRRAAETVRAAARQAIRRLVLASAFDEASAARLVAEFGPAGAPTVISALTGCPEPVVAAALDGPPDRLRDLTDSLAIGPALRRHMVEAGAELAHGLRLARTDVA